MKETFDYITPLKKLLDKVEGLALQDEYPDGTSFAVALFAPNGEVVFGSNLQGEYLAGFLETWVAALRAGALPVNYKKAEPPS
jgi:hypothetical protein